MLFNKENGVLTFLREAASLDEVNGILPVAMCVYSLFWFLLIQFSSCKEELLKLLQDYVKQLGITVLQYCSDIKVA